MLLRQFFRTAAVAAVAGLAGSQAIAANFSTDFIEFQLPDAWNCSHTGPEWSCRIGDSVRRNDAMIVLIGKARGPSDTWEKYEEHLKAPIKTKSGGMSKLQSIKNVEFGGQKWIDAMHGDAEMPNYFTRYLATIKDDIGVVLTYSVHKNKFDQYSKQLEDMVRTMRIVRKQPVAVAQNTPAPSKLPGGYDLAISNTQQAPVKPIAAKGADVADRPGAGSGGQSGALAMVLLAAAAGGGFFYYKKKKAGG